MIKIHEIATKLQKKMQFWAISWALLACEIHFYANFIALGFHGWVFLEDGKRKVVDLGESVHQRLACAVHQMFQKLAGSVKLLSYT